MNAQTVLPRRYTDTLSAYRMREDIFALCNLERQIYYMVDAIHNMSQCTHCDKKNRERGLNFLINPILSS